MYYCSTRWRSGGLAMVVEGKTKMPRDKERKKGEILNLQREEERLGV
jgi:hypothetical protein